MSREDHDNNGQDPISPGRPRSRPSNSPPRCSRSWRSGDRIAHYTLLKEIGSGGQGEVYLAHDEVLRRDVALKILSRQHQDAQTRRRFARSAESASRLTHPNLCAVHEFNEFDGTMYIVMPYVTGEPLSTVISNAKASSEDADTIYVAFDTWTRTTDVGGKSASEPDGSRTESSGELTHCPSDRNAVMEVARIIEDIARGLHVVHEEGLIHRDLKPANIMLTEEKVPVILDFGLVRDDASDQEPQTRSGAWMGTPAYMSPEQVSRGAVGIDRRSDIYSLGVILFECLTLRRPFSGSNELELRQAILFENVPNPQRLNPSIPDDLRVIVETAMEKSPARRYQTALALAEDLRRFQNLQPILARPAGPWVRTLRWVQRNRIVTIAGVVVFLAMLSVAVVSYFAGEEAKLLRDEALFSEEKALLAKREAEKARDVAKRISREKTRALADFERLADAKRLQEALELARHLWPARPEKIPALEAWLEKYRPLTKALSNHAAALKRMRRRAVKRNNGAGAGDHETPAGPLQARRPPGDHERVDGNTVNEVHETGDTRTPSPHREYPGFEQKPVFQESWVFVDDVEQWKHDKLFELVAGLESFVDENEGTFASVRNRLERARSIAQRTVGDYRQRWLDTAKVIAESPRYHGFSLKPQVGLIPLGQDPDSGLYEFLHLETHLGPIPSRDNMGHIPLTGNTGVIFVLIPSGTFWMGAQRDNPEGRNYDADARPHEGPPRHVSVQQPFFLSKYEMTQGQWQRCPSRNRNPSYYSEGFRDPVVNRRVDLTHPVEQVSWDDCVRVLQRVGLLLPTEEQWEFAARAGAESTFVGGVNNVADVARWGNIAGGESPFTQRELVLRDAFGIHAPVGQFKANAFGLHDVLGNVWEWTSTGLNATTRIARGGSYDLPAVYARLAVRNRITIMQLGRNLGLRPCLAVQE